MVKKWDAGAMSAFSPIGSRSSNGIRVCVCCVCVCVCVCVCMCVWTEWTWGMHYYALSTYQFIPCYAIALGRFSKAGLLVWMCFVIFRARSRSALPGRFLSRRCFTLCITVEVNLELWSNTVAVAKITVERGWRVEKKCLCVIFRLTRRSWVCRKKSFWGIL